MCDFVKIWNNYVCVKETNNVFFSKIMFTFLLLATLSRILCCSILFCQIFLSINSLFSKLPRASSKKLSEIKESSYGEVLKVKEKCLGLVGQKYVEAKLRDALEFNIMDFLIWHYLVNSSWGFSKAQIFLDWFVEI